jgi:hypothetical protein
MPNTRAEVVDAIRAAFPASAPGAVLAVLDRYGIEPYERERERVQLAIVELSKGSEEKLLHFVRVAKTDYRDVLYWQAAGPLSPEEGERAQDAARRLIDRWGKK